MSSQPSTQQGAAAGQIPAWLLSSAGASALLVAFGYLVEVARDQLLGVTLRENVALPEYGLAGARFVVNVITLGFRWVGLHPIVTIVVLFAAAGVALLASRWRRTSLTPRGVLTRFLVILVLLLTKAAFIDIPAALIENVLIERTETTRAFDAAPILNSATGALWRTMICAHATYANDYGLRCGERSTEKRKLEGLFLLNVFATTVLAAWALSISLPSLDEVSARSWRTGLVASRALTLSALIVAVIALPYHYGKVVGSTTFRVVTINFKTTVEASTRETTDTMAVAAPLTYTSLPATATLSGSTEPDPDKVAAPVTSTGSPPANATSSGSTEPDTDKVAAPATSTASPAANATPSGSSKPDAGEAGNSRDDLTKPALLLTGNADVLTLYYPSDDLVRELSRHDVESINVYPARDVLQTHMDLCLPKREK